ncbi:MULTISPECIES: putative holin-like toxin [Lactiplantibacillus]|nr:MULTISPECIES: putative holin-like toxin [Lactiplantibacillus]MCB7464044.1 putative holin-like toxin [Lactiplantibacillus argentoratensis]
MNTKDVLSLMLQTALLVVTLIGVIVAIVSLVA